MYEIYQWKGSLTMAMGDGYEEIMDSIKEIKKVLDVVSSTTIRANTKLDEVEHRFDERFTEHEKLFDSRVGQLESRMDSLTNTVRGHNGTPGLVAQVAKIETKLDMVLGLEHKPTPEKPKEDKNSVTWSTMAEKVILPIGVSAVLWFMLTILPQIVVMLGEGK